MPRPAAQNRPYKELTLQQLRSFAETARLGSLAAAAKALRLTHPTIREQVLALEREFGLKLVTPHGRGCRLTAEGRLLAELVTPVTAAAASLKTRFDELRAQAKVRLVVAGEFWQRVDAFRAQADRLGLGDAVTLRDGYVQNEEVAPLFASADAVVLPYRAATSSGVLTLAIEHGVPMIVTDVGGLPEVVVDGEAGLVVPPGDARALAAAVVRLCRERGLATRLRAGSVAARGRIGPAYAPGGVVFARVMLRKSREMTFERTPRGASGVGSRVSGKVGIANVVALKVFPPTTGRKSPAAALISCGSTVLIALSARSCVSLQVGFDGWHPWPGSSMPSERLVGPFQRMLPRMRRLLSVTTGFGRFVPGFGVRGPWIEKCAYWLCTPGGL